MDKFDVIEERPHPPGAHCVGDLVAAARPSEKITYRHVVKANVTARHYEPAQRGEYAYVPHFLNPPDLQNHPRAKRTIFPYVPLASIGTIQLEFRDYGSRRMGPFYSSWGSGLYLLTEQLLAVVLAFDGDSVEVTTPSIVGADGEPIAGYKVVMPVRVIDSADIQQSDVTVLHREPSTPADRPRALVQFTTGGFVIRDHVDAHSFVDEYSGRWFWSLDLIKAVAAAGIRGMRFVHPFYAMRSEHEITLPAAGDLTYSTDW